MPRYWYLIEGSKGHAPEEMIDSGFLDATDKQDADRQVDAMASDVSGYDSVSYSFDLAEA